MKKQFFFIMTTVAVLPILTGCAGTKSENYFESMNTFMKVQCYGKNSRKATEEAQKRISELEALISVTKPESEIYKINSSQEFPVEVSSYTAGLIAFSLEMAARTDGALNPCLYPVTSLWGFTKKQFRIPQDNEINKVLPLTDYRKASVSGLSVYAVTGMKFDLGAVGKGSAGDEAASVLKKHGIKSALLDLGGNIQLVGSKTDGKPWTIGIRNPYGQEPLGFLKAEDCAVITSGGYERFFTGTDGRTYIHIFDGKTGRPVNNNVISATAIGKTGLYCDALSTSVFVMGTEKAAELWRKYNDFDFIIVTDDRKILITSPAARNFTLNPEMKDFRMEIISRM